MMLKRAKRGFTIVEMLMVIGVLAVLTGIITTAATSVIHKTRVRKNAALRVALQAGLSTYYAQKGYWPPKKGGALQQLADNGADDGANVVQLTDKEYDTLMNSLVVECLNASGNPVMDVSGFTAIRQNTVDNAKYQENHGNKELRICYGEDVRSWVAKLRSNSKRGSTPQARELTFGYTSAEFGHFRRFRICYNVSADSVTVEYARKWDAAEERWVEDK